MLGFPTMPQYFNHVSVGPGPLHPAANISIIHITIMEEKNIIDCLMNS